MEFSTTPPMNWSRSSKTRSGSAGIRLGQFVLQVQDEFVARIHAQRRALHAIAINVAVQRQAVDIHTGPQGEVYGQSAIRASQIHGSLDRRTGSRARAKLNWLAENDAERQCQNYPSHARAMVSKHCDNYVKSVWCRRGWQRVSPCVPPFI